MSEKKIFSIDVAMDEPMFHAVHGLAKADGIRAPDLIRMLISTLIEERAAYYARLDSIFGKQARNSNDNPPPSDPDK